MVHLLLILLGCLVLFDLPLDVDVDKFLLTGIQFGEELVLENFLRVEGRIGKDRENLDQAEDTTFTYIGIRVVDHLHEEVCWLY